MSSKTGVFGCACVFSLAFGLLTLTAAQTQAAVIQFNSLAAFNAATAGVSVIDFNGIAPANSFVHYGNGPLVLSGSTFTGNGNMFIIDPGYYAPNTYPGGGFLNSDYAGNTNIINATLPSVTAVAFDFGGLFSGPTFTIKFSSGDSAIISTSDSIKGTNALTFVGFTSDTPLTGIEFVMPDRPEYNAIDNLRFGRAVPEPASLFLLGIGLLGAGFLRRR